MRKFEFVRLEYLGPLGFGGFDSPDRVRFVGPYDEFWRKVRAMGEEGFQIAAAVGGNTEILYLQREKPE
jgi:hypothetical protein